MEEKSRRELVLDAAQRCRDALVALNATGAHPMEGDGYHDVQEALKGCLAYLLSGNSDRVQRVIDVLLDSYGTVAHALKVEGREFAIEYARELGTEHGRNAADWWKQDSIGARTTGDTRARARAIMQGIDNGDPEVLNELPSSDLSTPFPVWGEQSDEMTVERLFEESCEAAGLDPDENRATLSDEVCSTYEEAFGDEVQDYARQLCAGHVQEEN